MTILLPGMPLSYGAPTWNGMNQALPYGGVFGQPVYVSSLSQIPAGAMPVTQAMLAQAMGGQAALGAQIMQDRSSIVGSVLKGAGIGAAAGAAFGAIPFLPLGIVSGGLVGMGVGAMVGLAKGLSDRNRRYATLQSQAQAQPQDPVAQTVAMTGAAAPAPAKVVMTAEQRRKFAARRRAEIAAQKAAAPK